MKNKEMNTIAQRIRVMRKYSGKTQIEFAKELGISQPILSALEQGKQFPGFEMIQKLGRLGFDLKWLLYGDTNEDEIMSHNVVKVISKWDQYRISTILSKMTKEQVRFCRQWLELYAKSLDEQRKKD